MMINLRAVMVLLGTYVDNLFTLLMEIEIMKFVIK